jgi:uncharacterized membrane protein (UPF0182 family)
MIYDYYKEERRKKSAWALYIVLGIAALTIIVAVTAGIYIQVIEHDEIGGYSGIYLRNLLYRLAALAVSFILIFAAMYATTRFIKNSAKEHTRRMGTVFKNIPVVTPSIVVALLGSLASKEYIYFKALQYFNSTPFNIKEPIFSKDIGYYIFERPFLVSIYEFFSSLALFIIFYTVFYYAIALVMAHNGVNMTWQRLKDDRIIRHNLINIAVYFIVKAFSYTFAKEELLYSKVLGVRGANFADVNLRIPFYTVLPFILIAVVVISLIYIYKGRIKNAIITIAVFPFILILFSIFTAAYQSFIVNPNELNYEQQYLKYSIENTREAYGLNKVEEYEFPETVKLTGEVLERNRGAIERIRVVDYQSTLETNIQLQAIRRFYTFKDGDIINYTINGKEIPVFIAARELDSSKLEKSYLNLKYKYTHGYGIVMNPVNRLREGGQADFILSGLEMESIDPNLVIERPQIYFGELTNDYVIVNASGGLDEIDYDGYRNTRYNGKAGITLNIFNRLLYSFKYGDINILISAYAKNATLLPNRHIVERASKAVPFIMVDRDPYIIPTKDGKLKWILDGYTTTDLYPFSQESDGINYIRNSLKIVIDAYDGKVEYYVIDEGDPLIRTYAKIYPGVFKFEPLPEDIARYMKYPEFLFELQTLMIRRYHLKPENVQEFYSNQDLWDISKYSAGKDTNMLADIDSYYNMISLPDGISGNEELILMRPFSPSNKHNMVSWLAARNSYENYGQMILFNFPKNTNILGPNQVEVKINQIDKISTDMTLWGQSGSDVYKGSLLVIPIESSVLYVQPIYIRSAGASSIPEVREIVAGFQWKDEFIYGIGKDFEEALANLVSRAEGMVAEEDDDNPGDGTINDDDDGIEKEIDNEILNQIIKKYDEIKRQLEELGRLIDALQPHSS